MFQSVLSAIVDLSILTGLSLATTRPERPAMLTVLTIAMVCRVLVAAASLVFDMTIRRRAHHADSPNVIDEYRGYRIIRHNHHFHIIEIMSGDVVEQEHITELGQAFAHINALADVQDNVRALMHGKRPLM